MTAQIFKSILFGALFGTALFFMPFFLLRIVLFIVIIGALFRLFARRRFGPSGHRRSFTHFTDRIRSMSDEEYTAFKQRSQDRCGFYRSKPAESM
ncbi:hypothetical protein [Xanthocytophaga agilis]|uniref:Uncharacterized protein n=1 Tax=Xanthocytophaga agilis TaxID=3048010 RepID=A0AAE3R7V7_9BACT|nr:hypothetical protein [Xanthocytophaga agilis]MDJ1503172.1 hypothetical protein [Xanthocytophaga agilis]